MKHAVKMLFVGITVYAMSAVAAPQLDRDFINFGYIQSNTILPYVPWKTLTHVGTLFVNFDANGNLTNPSTFTNRHADLKLNGAAHAAGTKVIVIVRNNGFSEAILDSVFQDPVKIENLAQNVKNLVMNDSYCAGVSFDFEFTWGAATRDGMTAFHQRIRQLLPPPYEISTYVNPTFSSTRNDIPNTHPHIDYLLHSTYDWASGNTPRSVTRFNSAIGQARNYLNAGLPPEKLVLTWAFYGRRWTGTSEYNVAGSSPQSQGFFNGLWDTTLRKKDNGPFTPHYVDGDETAWYTYTQNGSTYTTTYDSIEGLHLRIKAAQSFPASGSSPFNGVKLGGVAWWSLMWNGDYHNSFNSFNPITNSNIARARYYNHGYEIIGETLSPPGKHPYIFESFEGLNPNWETPSSSHPDTTAGTYTSSLAAAPAGAGRPADTTKAFRLNYNFSTAANRKLFFRHVLLNDINDKTVTDTNATICHVTPNTRFSGYYYQASAAANTQMRLALIDGNGELELSPAINLADKSGWNKFEWDINDASQIFAGTTAEPTLKNGNGVVNTKGGGARDIGFMGFVITSTVNGARTIYFDELSYEEKAPNDQNYVINEFRYANPAAEFVEIAGPPGPFPAGTELRFYSNATGNVQSFVNLAGQVIPPSGLFVVGDSGVPNVTYTPPGWGAARNITNTSPSGMQLFNTVSNFAYDSVTYKAMNGLAALAKQKTNGVTSEGHGWLGDIASGTDSANAAYTLGRYPDGADTNVNQKDFTFMKATPGQPNGSAVAKNTLINFSSAPPSLIQTYKTPQFVSPVTYGLPASPDGGNVYRLIDSAGGGVMGVLGEPNLGQGNGVEVTAQVLIPGDSPSGEAIGMGICGNQGSAFFSDAYQSSGYESGYWLLYENSAGILYHGLPDASKKLRLIMATNDNMHPTRAIELTTPKPLSEFGISPKTWATISIRLAPTEPESSRLTVKINDILFYQGPLPEDGPTYGPVQFGYRKSGSIATTSGMWIDGVMVKDVPHAGVDDSFLY